MLLITIVSFTCAALFNAPPLAFAIGLLLVGAAKPFFKTNSSDLSQLTFDGFVMTDTTYAGEAASNFIVKAITSNTTVQEGHIYVKDGIPKKFTIPRWDADYTDFIQDRKATPVSKGTMTVDGKTLQVADYMIYTEFNPRDFEAHWYATQQNPTLIDRSLPTSVESIVAQQVLKRHDKYMNKAIWRNNTLAASNSIYKYYDGLLRKAYTANSGTDQTIFVGSPTTINTAALAASEFQKGYDLIPAQLKYDPNMKIFCSYYTFDLFMQYQITNQTYKGADITQIGVPTFRGIPVVKIPDFPDNTYLIAKGMPTPESNLWLGLNSTEDASLEVRQLQANSELWFIKMLMKVDVQIGWNSESIYYGGAPSTAP